MEVVKAKVKVRDSYRVRLTATKPDQPCALQSSEKKCQNSCCYGSNCSLARASTTVLALQHHWLLPIN